MKSFLRVFMTLVTVGLPCSSALSCKTTRGSSSVKVDPAPDPSFEKEQEAKELAKLDQVEWKKIYEAMRDAFHEVKQGPYSSQTLFMHRYLNGAYDVRAQYYCVQLYRGGYTLGIHSAAFQNGKLRINDGEGFIQTWNTLEGQNPGSTSRISLVSKDARQTLLFRNNGLTQDDSGYTDLYCVEDLKIIGNLKAHYVK